MLYLLFTKFVPKMIVFPTADELPVLANLFAQKHVEMFGTVLAYDGTHLPILKPFSETELYINRKGCG
jgi:hypothetical protein